MARRSKAYLEGMNRVSEELARVKSNDSGRVAKRELKESQNEVFENTEWLVSVPKELKNAGAEVKNAPTTNQERPRAWTIAYHPEDRKLVVVFRDNTWWIKSRPMPARNRQSDHRHPQPRLKSAPYCR